MGFRAANGAVTGPVTDPGSAGDFLLALCSNDQGSVPAPPDGTWTQLDNHDVGGDGQRWVLLAKDSSDGTGSSLDFGNVGATIVAAFSGVDPSSLVFGFQDDSSLTTTTVRGPSITTAANGCTLLWLVGIDNGGGDGGSGSVVSWTPPTGFTQRTQVDAEGENLVLATATQATHGATGTISGTCSAAGQGPSGYTIAIAPASGGGTNTPMTLTVSIAQTPGRARAAALSKSGTAQQSPARARSVSRLLAATLAQTLARGISAGMTRTGAQAQLVALTRAQGKALVAGVAQSASRTMAAASSLSATSSQIATRARNLARSLAAAAVAVGSADEQQAGGTAHFATLTATQTQTMTMLRALARTLGGTAAGSPARTRTITQGARTAAAAAMPTLVKGRGFFRTITVSTAQTAVRALGLGITRGAAAAQLAGYTRACGRVFAIVAAAAGARARALGIARSGSSSQSASQQAGAGAQHLIELAAIAAQFPTLRYIVRRLVRAGYVSLLPLDTVVCVTLLPLD